MSGRRPYKSRRRRGCALGAFCSEGGVIRPGDRCVRIGRHDYAHAEHIVEFPRLVHEWAALVAAALRPVAAVVTAYAAALGAAWIEVLRPLRYAMPADVVDRLWDLPVAVAPTSSLGVVRVVPDGDVVDAGTLDVEAVLMVVRERLDGYICHPVGPDVILVQRPAPLAVS